MNVPPPKLEKPFTFTPGSADGDSGRVSGGVNEDPVRRTQRQIGAALQELAIAARSEIQPPEFIAQVLDQTLQVLVAHGTLWFRGEEPGMSDAKPFVVARRGTTTDQTLGPHHQTAVRELVAEVLRTETPAVIPPTPLEHWDPSTTDLINPTESPLAVVPIPVAPHVGPPHAIAVFLESGGSVATQRGYLRFIAQVADLAAGHLEVQCGREMNRQLEWAAEVDRQSRELAGLNRSIDIRDRMVDVAATLFQFDHVALCRVDSTNLSRDAGGSKDAKSSRGMIRGSARRRVVVSVSHCETIDQHGAAVDRIVGVVERAFEMRLRSDAGDSVQDSKAEGFFARSTANIEWLMVPDSAVQSDSTTAAKQDSTPAIHEVIFLESSPIHWMVVATRQSGLPTADIAMPVLDRWLRHTHELASSRAKWESSWIARLLTSRGTPPRVSARRRHLGLMIGLATLVAATFVVPVPQTMTAPAVLVPAEVQAVFGPRSALVETVHVDHEQPVAPGDPLITLRSPDLDDQILQLAGRRSVLTQRLNAIASDLVSPGDRRRQEQLQDDQQLIDEQLTAVTAEYESLIRMQEKMVLRSRMTGTVDAWQIRQTLDARPINRGDLLLRVLPEHADWWVMASVPSGKISRLTRAVNQEQLSASLRVDGSDQPPVSMSWDQLGPAKEGHHQVRFRLLAESFPPDEAWRTEASGQVEMNCGKTTLANWLWGDSIRWAKQEFQLVMGGGS